MQLNQQQREKICKPTQQAGVLSIQNSPKKLTVNSKFSNIKQDNVVLILGKLKTSKFILTSFINVEFT